MFLQKAILAGSLALTLTFGAQPEKASRSVVLPESAARQMTDLCSRPGAPKFDGTWTLAEADVKTLESRLSRVSRLRSRSGILYAPDYVANAGGVINGTIELLG